MNEVRDRINLVKAVGERRVSTGHPVFDSEIAYLQFRKTLELIAFASLTAHKERYAAAHADFAEHWKAKAMLKKLAQINPEFYPVPLGPVQVQTGWQETLSKD